MAEGGSPSVPHQPSWSALKPSKTIQEVPEMDGEVSVATWSGGKNVGGRERKGERKIKGTRE